MKLRQGIIAALLWLCSLMADDVATFAGGCFWCLQHDLMLVPGVVSTQSGYTGGHVVNPTYEDVSSGESGHVESVQVVYNPKKISYEELVNVYFHNIDPTRNDGQFCDTGEQYRPVIFYHNQSQKEIAEKYKQALTDSHKVGPVKVDILPAGPFYPAEEYHQNYAGKNPIRYKFYRTNCGRDRRLREVWGTKGK
jgi:peptide-methionine (S)-S-oxide reductase